MNIKQGVFNNRKGWAMENDVLSMFVMAGGGHIAQIKLHDRPEINPLWEPPWQTLEPWQYKKQDKAKYGAKLLACISGHNLCLGAFGDPSPEEARAGLGGHGEAPVTRWRLVKKKISTSGVSMTCACELPIAQMKFERTLSLRKGSHVAVIKEKTTNLARKDQPFTMCQHVTFGPPFLERGVTVFDMNAVKAQTFPGRFGEKQRLKQNASFQWPFAPGANGKKIDIRTLTGKTSGDFTTQLIDPSADLAWFSALNPKLGILVAYTWNRQDYPWVGNWEENHSRKTNPWLGKTLARGMEFANTPFPTGLRAAVDMGRFQNQQSFAWLPALSSVSTEYTIIIKQVDPGFKGVANINNNSKKIEIDLLT